MGNNSTNGNTNYRIHTLIANNTNEKLKTTIIDNDDFRQDFYLEIDDGRKVKVRNKGNITVKVFTEESGGNPVHECTLRAGHYVRLEKWGNGISSETGM